MAESTATSGQSLHDLLRHHINRHGLRVLMLGLAIGGVLLFLALRQVDVPDVASDLAAAHRWPIALIMLAQLTFYGLKAVRWRSLLPPDHPISVRTLAAPMMYGFAVNNLLPLRIGELVRTWAGGEHTGLPKTLILASLVVERLFDLVALAIVLTLGMLFGSLHTPLLEENRSVLYGASALAAVAIISLILLPLIIKSRPERLLKLLPKPLRQLLEKPLLAFQEGLGIVRSPSQFLALLLNSVVQWSLMGLCVGLSIYALGVDNVGVLMACTVLGLIIFGISMPTGPAFVGTIEYAFVLGMGLFAVNETLAFAAAIYYHVLSFVFVQVSAALLYLFARNTAQ